MLQQGGRATEPREPEQLEKADPPAHQVHQHLGCLFSLVPHHGVQAGGLRGSSGMGSWGAQACPPPCGERALGEIWRESELRAQHFPLSVFLLEEFFFPLSADDFTISWTWGKETLAFAPRPPTPTPNAGQSLAFHQKPELQSFLKMRWRLLPSPAPVPSPFPLPSLKPSVLAKEALGGDPKHILPLAVMLQKLKTHLRAGHPPSVSSQKVAEKALGLSSVPRVKDAQKPAAWSPWGGRLTLASGAVAGWLSHAPTHPQGSLEALQNSRPTM